MVGKDSNILLPSNDSITRIFRREPLWPALLIVGLSAHARALPTIPSSQPADSFHSQWLARRIARIQLHRGELLSTFDPKVQRTNREWYRDVILIKRALNGFDRLA